ncbi:MAG: succinylglutamate desuccinylase/aspartoacylase family protein [Rhodobacteraceae bacterium]|nr:succinylglutamate desuccinylase/aspartoacylase family protein [Paracoccaceae bacterium]
MDKFSTEYVRSTIDPTGSGHRHGDLAIRWSDNSNPLGVHLVPVTVIGRGTSPTALLVGGSHGDEFEGPVAILRAVNQLDPARMTGTVIAIPCLNMPAVKACSRTSPLDGMNMNRVFPGHATGSPSEMLADYIERVILPRCSVVLDLHAGGTASVFAACTLLTRTRDDSLYTAGMDLAQAFGLPVLWLLNENNDARSLNSAAERAGVPMIAAELGGGGGCDPGMVQKAEAGILNCLAAAGICPEPADPFGCQPETVIEISGFDDILTAPHAGLFDRALHAGATVRRGQRAGTLFRFDEPGLRGVDIICPHDGFVLAHTNRGKVERGDMLGIVTRPCQR